MQSETGNQLELEIIAYHGWGFDSRFWTPWKNNLSDIVSFKPADKGYFYNEKRPRFSKAISHKILFTHSYGLHWCPKENIEEATCIVIFNGFLKFHPSKPEERKRSKAILNKMIDQFEDSPRKVLKKFWENAFSPDKKMNIPKGKPDTQMLLNDLKAMNSSVFDLSYLKKGKPIISLDGGSDMILNINRGKKITQLTEGNAVYHFIKEAGHSLPVTHYQDCWSFINAMIPIFQHDGNYRRKRHQSGRL